ncbi:MAG TPA: glycosyltransferase family 2 protein [Bryobacteraceae bacterium]|nr:glycosyltransferase family 2 protein [Bryobacteraceae bacterium]
MKNGIQVSVAIATYNRADMLRQAIEAACAQTRPPDEIVVADDASTDHTWAMLKELARHEPRLRIFRRERNSGGAENWSFAIGQTHGDYIAWCSDDDRFTPSHLEASVAYLEEHPEVGLVHSGFVDAIEAEDQTQTLPRPLRFPETRILEPRDLLRYVTRYYDWPFHPSTLVLRRTVWERTGPFEADYALADTDWFVRAVERFPAALLARYGAYNRRHPGNWSNRLGSARMQNEIFQIVEGSIGRRWPGIALQKTAWKAVWRAHVRLRLLLTLRARLKTRHAEAACAAWRQLAQGTGRRLPETLTRLGSALLRWRCAGREPEFEDARHSVSPL